MDELISVVVPAYNMEQYIEECVDSILAQTYRRLEVILVDDGSTDATGRICDQYAERDARVVVIHQENRGLPRSRKVGVAAARGAYVGFVDSDDWVDSNMYGYLCRELEESGAQLVTSGYIVERPDGSSAPVLGEVPEGVYHPRTDPLFCRNMILVEPGIRYGIPPFYWNKLFRKCALVPFLEKVDDRLTHGEDYACIYPCVASAETVRVTGACMYHYRVRAASMSRSSDEEYFTRLNAMYLTLKRVFERHPQAPVLMKELNACMCWRALSGVNEMWGLQLESRVPSYQFLCENTRVGKGTVLYSAGEVGRAYYQGLRAVGLHRDILWVDRNYQALQAQGLPVEDPKRILSGPYDAVIVPVQARELYESIRQDLIGMGVRPERIFWAEPRLYR